MAPTLETESVRSEVPVLGWTKSLWSAAIYAVGGALLAIYGALVSQWLGIAAGSPWPAIVAAAVSATLLAAATWRRPLKIRRLARAALAAGAAFVLVKIVCSIALSGGAFGWDGVPYYLLYAVIMTGEGWAAFLIPLLTAAVAMRVAIRPQRTGPDGRYPLR